MRTFTFIGTVIVSLTAACSGGSTPQHLLSEYANALEANNASRAYALTTPEYRATTSESRFESDFHRRVEGSPELTDALRNGANGTATLYAEVPYSDFESVEMEYIRGRWVITGGVGVFFSQSTPRETLLTFIRTLRTRDTSTMLRLVPAEYRARIDAEALDAWLEAREDELAETLALLEASVEAPIRQQESEATMRYGAREMHFVREGTRWVIEDFE